MPSKDKKVIGVKVSERQHEMIETYANTHNLSISALMSLCIEGLINGDIEIEKGELKLGVNPNGYAVPECFDIPIYESKIEKAIDGLAEKGYPDRLKKNVEEQILESLRNMPRYDPRRTRDDPC